MSLLTTHRLFVLRAACFVLLMSAVRLAASAEAVITQVTTDGRSILLAGCGWSPDGNHLLFIKQFDTGRQLWLANADGSEPKAISPIGALAQYEWSPDSQSIAYCSGPNWDEQTNFTLSLYHVASGQTDTLASELKRVRIRESSRIMWSPDATAFIMLVGRVSSPTCNDALLYTPATKTCLALTPDHYHTDYETLGWSPDGRTIAMQSKRSPSGDRYRLWLCNRDGANLHPITPEDMEVNWDPAWSPDGKWIVVESTYQRTDNKTDLWVMRPDGSDLHAVTHGSNDDTAQRIGFWNGRWSPDGRYLCCPLNRTNAAGTIKYQDFSVLDITTGELIPVVKNDPNSDQDRSGQYPRYAFSTQHQLALEISQATIRGRGTTTPVEQERRNLLCLFDLTTRTMQVIDTTCPKEDGRALIMSGTWGTWVPLFSPDGTRLAYAKAKVISAAQGQFEPDIYIAQLAGTPAATPVVLPATPVAAVPDVAPEATLAAKTLVAGKPVLVTLRNRTVDDVAKALPAQYGKLYTLDSKLNAFVVTPPDAETLDAFRQYVQVLDQAPLVMVDVLVTELTQDASRQLGLDWEFAKGRISGRLPTTIDGSAGQVIYKGVGVLNDTFFVTLSALEEQGKAKVRANPRVVTISGSQATINIRRTDNFFYVSSVTNDGRPVKSRSDISAEIMLKIQPMVYADNRIRLVMEATVDSFIFGAQGDLPDTTRRQASTELIMDNGQTVILGGLTLIEDARKVQKVPVLGDLPVLGSLFRKTNVSSKETTIVIFVNPHTVNPDEQRATPFITPPGGME